MSNAWAKGSDSRWRAFRVGILERDRWTCLLRLRGCTDKATCVDHVVPLAMGGAKYDPRNCRAACAHCNTSRRVTRAQYEPEPRRVSNW